MQAAPEEARRPGPVKSVEAGPLGSREASAACTDRQASAQAAAQGTGHAQEAGAAATEAAGGSDLKLSLPSGTGAGLGRAQPGAVPPSGPSGVQQQQQPASVASRATGTGATSSCSPADAQQVEQQQRAGAQQCSNDAASQVGRPQGSAAILDASSVSSSASTARSQGSGSSHLGPASSDDLQLSPEVKHVLSMHDHAACCSTIWQSVFAPSTDRAQSISMMPLQDYAALMQRFRQVYTGPAKEDVTPEELADDMMRCQYNAAVDALQARWGAKTWCPVCLVAADSRLYAALECPQGQVRHSLLWEHFCLVALDSSPDRAQLSWRTDGPRCCVALPLPGG